MRPVARLFGTVFAVFVILGHSVSAVVVDGRIRRQFDEDDTTTGNGLPLAERHNTLDDISDEAEAVEYIQRMETLVDQYRNLIAKSIMRLSGACIVYDRLTAASDEDYAGERFAGTRIQNTMQISHITHMHFVLHFSAGHRTNPINIEQYIVAILKQLQADSSDQIAATFARQNASEPGLNVLFYIVTTSNMLRDAQLDALLAAMLNEHCCSAGPASKETPRSSRCTSAQAPMQKRNRGAMPATTLVSGGDGTSSIFSSLQPPQKKQRFHAWGGKRSRGGATLGQAPVVIRAPFHAWGGRK